MKRQEREGSNHDSLTVWVIVGLAIAFLIGISFVRAPVEVPPEITRSAVPRPLQTVTSHVPTPQGPSSTPEPREAKIYVVAPNIPSYWKIGTTLSEWNLADRYADFVPMNYCMIDEPCLTIKMGKLADDTAAITTFNSDGRTVSIILNRSLKNPIVASSITCHELGHVLGLPHINGTVNTCMTAKDGFYRTRPTEIDSRLVNSYGKWEFWKMYDLSGKDVDIRSLPR